MGSLFDKVHLTYIFVSLALTVAVLWLAKRSLKTDFTKDLFLKFFALATFFLHLSPMWVDFLRDGSAHVADNVLFPIYFCNMSMYMLLVVAYWGNKKTKFFKYLASFTSYAGFFGAMISLFYPDYYLGASSIFIWGVFKSMLSHSTMLVGALWLMLGGYYKVRLSNALTYFAGLLFYGLVGVIVNYLFVRNGLSHPNAMYLDHAPLEEAPFLNAYTIAFLMVVLIIAFATIYERIVLDKDKRTNPKKIIIK